MQTRSFLILAGVLAGVVGTLCFTGPTAPPAAAQNPAPLPVGRFQISAYASGPGGREGAYILDTATGEVFAVERQDAPRYFGKAKPTK